MTIKDLEIISEDLLRKKLANLQEKEKVDLLEKIPQKPAELFVEPYKNYFIMANFPGEGWLVILNPKAKKILDLIDGKKTVREIYDIFLENYSEKFNKEDIFLFWRDKISPKDIFNKTVLGRPFVGIEDFLKFFRLLKKTKLISFLSEEEKYLEPEKRMDIWLHLTNQCNFRCKYCYVSKTPKAMEDKTAFLAIDRIFESAKRNGVKSILIRFAGGEPLLEFPAIKKIVAYIYDKYGDITKSEIKMSFLLLTNATLINEEIIKFIKDNKIGTGVSLDSADEFQNKKEEYGQGEKNLATIKEKINMLKKEGVKFSVMTVVSKANLAGLPALADWLMKNNIPFRFLLIRKNPMIGWNLIPKNEELIKTISKIYDSIALNMPRYSIGAALCNGVPKRYDNFFDGGCGVGKIFTPINEIGDIYPCHMTFSQKEMKLGSIVENPEVDIYSLVNSQKARAFNPGIKERIGCQDCEWKYICANPCPMSIFFEKGNPALPTYYCQMYKTLIPKAIHLEAERLIRYKK